MRKMFTLLATLFVAFSSNAQFMAESPAPMTLIRAGRLLDPRTGNVLSPAAVLIENGKIKEVGSPARLEADAPAGVKTIDLGGATLLPGLIDSHAHLLLNITVPTEPEIKNRFNGMFVPGLLLAIVESPSKRVLLGAQLAREDLESGFTTVRNLGHSGIDGDAALRDAINAGRVPGPRILASGRKIAHGYIQSLNPAVAEAILREEFLSIAGPDQARQAVQANLFYNIDVIKVAIDDDISERAPNPRVSEAGPYFPPASKACRIAVTLGAFSLSRRSSLCSALQISEHLCNPPLKIIPDVHPHPGAWISTASSPSIAAYRTCRPCNFPR